MNVILLEPSHAEWPRASSLDLRPSDSYDSFLCSMLCLISANLVCWLIFTNFFTGCITFTWN